MSRMNTAQLALLERFLDVSATRQALSRLASYNALQYPLLQCCSRRCGLAAMFLRYRMADGFDGGHDGSEK